MSLRDNNKIYKIYNIFIFSFPFFLFFLSFFSLFFLKYIIKNWCSRSQDIQERRHRTVHAPHNTWFPRCRTTYFLKYEEKVVGYLQRSSSCERFLYNRPPHTSPSVGCAHCRMCCSIWWLAVVMIMCCIGRRHSSWRGIIGSTFTFFKTCPWWFTG